MQIAFSGIKKTTVYSLLTAFLTGIFISIIIAGGYGLGKILGQRPLWLAILAAFTVAFIFQPLRDAVQKIVDKLFYRGPYDYQRILGKYSQALVKPATDLGRYAKLIPYLLWKSLRLSGASVMVLDRENHRYLVRAAEGESAELIDHSMAEDSALIERLSSGQREIDKEEIKRILKREIPAAERKLLEGVLAEIEQLKAILTIPSISESEYFNKPTLLLAINLGRKLSDEAYSREDIDFLRTMANQASIIIEYAFILEELKKKQEQVIKSEKLAALGTTVAGIAHELKNPLTYLLTVAQSMAENWEKPTFKEGVVAMFPAEVERMKLIIDGLSDYSKAHELRMEPVDVAAILEKVLAILGYEIKKNNVFIIKNYSAETALAQGDKNRLVQVFMNIIANAVQAMGEKGGDLSITTRAEEKEIRISIMDTGPGIPRDKLQKIFDPFFTTKDSGTGLGLSITKKIIDEHKGSIYVDSHVGDNTTFTICLPRA